MRVVVAIDDDVTIRTAHVLAAMANIEEVAVLGTPRSKVFSVVKSAAGADVVVGQSGQAAAESTGIPLVTERMAGNHGVIGASPQGLALALSRRVSQPSLIAVTADGDTTSGSGREVRFPDPVGRKNTHSISLEEDTLHVSPPEEDWSAVLVEGDRALSTVDDTRFLNAITLACGVVLADRAPTRVWDHAGDYIAACRKEGLVFATRD
ncbi:MAG: hypothetical protein GEU79_14460 [Acidimicrobiia bacterium]|nr:hypothetical protein [Acidimicrobiia bacterium]